MNPNIKKWLDKNATGYEVQTTNEGKSIVFVPSIVADEAFKYFNKFHPSLKTEWRGNYSWLAIFMS
ncbi:hypothetical protein BK120_21820 [Paenibacillus sp. FSL A5-0031]|uniref:hypothetical protein n=1 Tax=Paenibacillus sp. FSL A5-0031 TaxID=1920420 RepID=UPI00096F0554|nr:hypothetical protein [Paenibacillus sp. FSL A5-0031]OME79617.1 hypothetical protein BK120_21820 [Paenibacillus sp. FSL A5-0031]